MLATLENSPGATAFVAFAFLVILLYLLVSFRATLRLRNKSCPYCGGTEVTEDRELHWSASTGNMEKAQTICANCHTPMEI